MHQMVRSVTLAVFMLGWVACGADKDESAAADDDCADPAECFGCGSDDGGSGSDDGGRRLR